MLVQFSFDERAASALALTAAQSGRVRRFACVCVCKSPARRPQDSPRSYKWLVCAGAKGRALEQSACLSLRSATARKRAQPACRQSPAASAVRVGVWLAQARASR